MSPKFFALFACAALATLPACHGPRATTPALRIQIGAEPVSLDPTQAEDGLSLFILGNLMDGLVGYDGAGHLERRLAASYRISENGRRYDFRLRGDARWSDGQPVRAEDFALALRRALAPASGSRLGSLLRVVSAIEAHGAAAGERGGETLTIRLARSAPYFLQLLALPPAYPLRADVLRAHGDHWPLLAPVTGAYRITAHAAGERYVLEPNPGHRASVAAPAPRPSGAAWPARIELVIVQDESTALRLFERGDLEILPRVPALDVVRLRHHGLVQSAPFAATYYLAFNVRKAPFDRVEWRRAFAAAIRKDEIARALVAGAVPARSWIPPGLEGYLPYPPASPVAAPAARLRAEGARLAPITAASDGGARNGTVMEKVQADVRATLGLRLALEHSEWKTYVRSLQTDAPPIFRFGWLAPFMDPITHLEVFTTGGPNNYTHWSDAEYDRLVAEIGGLAPGPARRAKIRRAQAILVDEQCPVVPIFHYVQNVGVSARVHGFHVSPSGMIAFEELSYDP